MTKRKTTFHQWYDGPYANDGLNLIWSGWFLWVTDFHVDKMKRLRRTWP